jgi:hypothetical protein
MVATWSPASRDKTLRVWDLKARNLILRFTLDATVTCIVAQDDRKIVAGDGFGRLPFLRLIDTDDRGRYSQGTGSLAILI